MRRSSRTPEGGDQEPSLFDLPLEPAHPDRSASSERRVQPLDDDPVLPLVPARPAPAPRAVKPAAPRPVPRPPPVQAASSGERETTEGEPAAGLKSRFLAGAADLLVHAAIAVAAVAGSRLLGARPSADDWPALTLFLLTFSFLYTVLPLAFWGQTLGMAWAGLAARGRDGEALAFDQAARRWLGALATTAVLGLPLLLAIGGRRSLSDRVSGSATYPAS